MDDVTLEQIEEAARRAGATVMGVTSGKYEIVHLYLDGHYIGSLRFPGDKRYQRASLRILNALALAKEEAEQVRPSGSAVVQNEYGRPPVHLYAPTIEACARQLGGRVVWGKR